MTSPFLFHFSVDPRGFPLAATLVDLEIRCGACHNLNFQRYFFAIPLHPITLERLVDFNDTLSSHCQGECSFCQEDLTPDGVCASVLTWGFSDGLGVLRILTPSDPTGKQLFLAEPYATFDPQLIPHFEPNDAEVPLKALTEEEIFRVFGRYFSVKRAILGFIRDSWEKGLPMVRDITKSLRMVVWRTSSVELEEYAELIEEALALSNEEISDGWAIFSIEECGKFTLPTQPHSQEIAGRAETWLGPSIWEKITSGRLKLKFLVNLEGIKEALMKVLSEGLISFQTTTEGGLNEIFAPNDEPFSSLFPPSGGGRKVSEEAPPHHEKTTSPRTLTNHKPAELAYSDIAKRAIYTGMPPETAARLTGEEIIAQFLRVDRSVRGPGKLITPNPDACC